MLTGLVLVFWAFLLTGAGTGMDIFKMSYPGIIGHRTEHTSMMSMPGYGILQTLAMWWGMMLAMMLPGVWAHIPRKAQADRPVSWALASFFAGYASVWLGFSVVATAIQYWLVSADLLDHMFLWSRSATLSAALLTAAGVYQLLGIKRQYLRACTEARDVHPTFATGLGYGRACLLATAPLMSLLFVGGVMNIYWIAGLALVAAVEKSLPNPRWFSALVGGSLLLTAVWLLASFI